MAKGSAPICFRVTDAERAVLETVAWHMGETLSEFIRNTIMDAASDILAREGVEALTERYAESKRQETDEKVRSTLAAVSGRVSAGPAVAAGRRARGSGDGTVRATAGDRLTSGE